MKKKIFLIVLISSISISLNISFSQTVNQEWIRTYPTDGSSGNFIQTDLAGNVYVVGLLSFIDAPNYTFVQKFNPSGAQLFTTVIDTPCRYVGAYLDGLNNLYIAGYNFAWAPPKSSIVKYSSSGMLLWRISESLSSNDRIQDMAGDINGNSYILRNKNNINQIIKYNSTGIQQLLFNVTDTIYPYSISLDNQNNIIVNGDAYLANVYTIITIKFSSSGVKQWRSLFVPPGGYSSSLVSRIKTGTTGNIYIMASASQQANSRDYTVIKYNPAGLQLWVSYYNRYQFDDVKDMAVDSTENIYLTGNSGTVKLNLSGSVQWSDTTSRMVAAALDKYNNVYVTGSSFNFSMMKTIKISNSGNLLWSINYTSGNPYLDQSIAIALDTSRNVFITGIVHSTPLPGFRGNAGTIKYSQLVGIHQINSEIPKSFSLSQNYPNPFNPVTNIKFRIPKSGLVKLTIYDVLGKEVQTLVNQQLSPGTYETDFDGSNLPSGVYYYKLETEQFSETKKMVLIK